MATYGQAKQQLVRLSGHPELVTDAKTGDFTDHSDYRRPKARDFFEAADRYCQLRLPYKGEIQETTINAAIGDYLLELPANIRFVSRVLMPTGYTPLIRATRDELLATYEGPLSELTNGTPAHWAPGPYVPGDPASILIASPTDTAIAITVRGGFYSEDYSDDDNETWWSANHPDVLIRCARAFIKLDLEINAAQAKALFEQVDIQLTKIYHDTIREEAGELPHEQMIMRPW